MRKILFICDNCEKEFILIPDDEYYLEEYENNEKTFVCLCLNEYCSSCKNNIVHISEYCNICKVCNIGSCDHKHELRCKIKF